MKLIRALFFAVVTLLPAYKAVGQYYLSGTDGSSVRWKQLAGRDYRVIFPESDSGRAFRYFEALNRATPLVTRSVGGRCGRLDVVLHSLSSRSNALTVWAPSRIEVFPVPPDDSYSQSWPEQLAFHELRHVAQLSSLNRGLTGALAAIFGQHVTGLVFGLHLPQWFAEGDAVYSETVWSESGRGRDPLFRMESRAWAASGEKRSYNQLLFGSFVHYSPGAYNFGYEMVSKVRTRFGVSVWDSALLSVARRPWQPFSFSAGLKRMTGFSTGNLFDSTLVSLAGGRMISGDLFPVVHQKVYTNFYRPRRVAGGRLAAVRSRYGELADIEVFDSLLVNAELIIQPGNINTESFDAKKNFLVWAETEPHLRWEHRQYSVVWYYDLLENKLERVAPQTRWYTPALSPGAGRLAVVETDEQGDETLVVVSFPEGKEMRRIPVVKGEHLMSLSWAGESEVAGLLLDDAGKRLVKYNLVTGEQLTLFDFGYRFVLSPSLVNGKWVVTTEWNGDAVLAEISGDSLRLLYGAGYGVHQASQGNPGELLCNVYTPGGYRISRLQSPVAGSSIGEQQHWDAEDRFASAEKQLETISRPDQPGTPQVTDYSRIGHLFRFHSWAPAAIDVASQELRPGITLLSQNSLGTAATTFGYRYLNAQGNHELFGTFDYYGFYPVISIEATLAGRSTNYLTSGGPLTLHWTQTTVDAGTYLPLKYSAGRHVYGLTPGLSFKGEWYRMDNDSPVTFSEDTYLSLNCSLQLYHMVRSSVNDLYPRWGQIIYGLYRQSPFWGASLGRMTAVEGTFYFPGVLPHHGFRLYGGYEDQPSGRNYYGFVVDFPRGVPSFRIPHRVAGSLTYAFPLIRPDWDLGKLAYVKRLGARVFYDANYGFTSGLDHYVSSAGMELFADWHLLRLVTPLNSGIRLSWSPEDQSYAVEWLFTVSFDVF